MNRIQVNTVAEFPSSSEPGVLHLVKRADLTEDLVLFCTCKGFKFANKCIHVTTYMEALDDERSI